MKNIFRALLAATLLGLSASFLPAEEIPTGNRPAPALAFKDVITGQKVSLADLKGKVVVVDFWATWCVPCKTEIPGYIELQKKYGKDGLVIIGVSLDQAGPKVVKKFAQENGLNYTLVMGETDDLDALTGKPGADIVIPTTFLINRAGVLVHAKRGALPPDEYEAIVKQAL
jgi:thiol-disulfide isomerase/thioredoxin